MRIVMRHPYIMGKCVVNYAVDEKQTLAGYSPFASGERLKIKHPVTFLLVELYNRR